MSDNRSPALYIFLGLGIAALVGGLIVFASTTGSVPMAPVFIGIIAVIGVVIVVGVTSAIRAEKARVQTVYDAIRDAGFMLYEKPSAEEKERLFAPYTHLKELGTKHKGLRWFASNTIDGREFAVFRHTYTVHTGQTSITIAHIVAATPCPVWWPTLSLTKESLFHRLKDKLGGSDMRVESAAFNDHWRVKTDNEDLALVLLTPEMQRWLEHPPKHESWRIGDGVLCCTSRASSTKMPPLEIVERVRAFLSMLPPEAFADQG